MTSGTILHIVDSHDKNEENKRKVVTRINAPKPNVSNNQPPIDSVNSLYSIQ